MLFVGLLCLNTAVWLLTFWSDILELDFNWYKNLPFSHNNSRGTRGQQFKIVVISHLKYWACDPHVFETYAMLSGTRCPITPGPFDLLNHSLLSRLTDMNLVPFQRFNLSVYMTQPFIFRVDTGPRFNIKTVFPYMEIPMFEYTDKTASLYSVSKWIMFYGWKLRLTRLLFQGGNVQHHLFDVTLTLRRPISPPNWLFVRAVVQTN